MSNSKEVFERTVSEITLDESLDEKKSIAYLLLEHKFGINKTQIIANSSLTDFNWGQLDTLLERINHHEPIQYILGEQEFYGRTFKVDRHVLIPRPETELLVEKTIEYLRQCQGPVSVLDIGTGSGCISVTLALELPMARIYATDLHSEAISAADTNAERLKAAVSFSVSDILKDPLPDLTFNAIVSNPPYIVEDEMPAMKENVLRFEPHSALFVPNNDPLIFYKAIAAKAKTRLVSGGLLAFEINEKFGNEMTEMLRAYGYAQIQVIKDLSDKDRIVTAQA